ncbi:MAG: class I SAM-dependent methyltransferase [Spirochaetota bacterium]
MEENENVLTESTIQHYESRPEQFWQGTKDHDVTQNYDRFLSNIPFSGSLTLLDFGCGPGRDLLYFKQQGHKSYGLDGCASFCKMAREYAEVPVLQQNFVNLELQKNFFHGIFANASLFHVPKKHLSRVLTELRNALQTDGVLFSSNPRGRGESFQEGGRYGNYMELEIYKDCVEDCGFRLLEHYYRPDSLPIAERPWLACVFQAI